MSFYVYLLARPDVDPFVQPFYVGKGQGRRIDAHEQEARAGKRSHKCNMIRKIWADGGQVQRVKVLDTSDERLALSFECTLIAVYRARGVRLCNITEGGRGAVGLTVSPEARAKRSAQMKAHFANPEARAKLSAQMKAHLANPEVRAQYSARLKAATGTLEHLP